MYRAGSQSEADTSPHSGESRQSHEAELERESGARDPVAILAHDLAQPLSSIASYARGCVLRLKSPECRPEDLMPAMERILSEVTRAAGLVQRLRELPQDSRDGSPQTSAAQQQRESSSK